MPSNYDQPFREALEYFTAKGYQLNPGGWTAIAQEANAGAFTVAKVAQMDILEDIKGALQNALESGQTYEQFASELIPALEQKGWLGAASRLGNIFETNLAAAYNVGRWTQIQQIADERPFLQYRGIRDNRTRRLHMANFGKTYRVGDPFWSVWYPPNGFRCRCYVVAVDQGYLDTNKLSVSSGIPVDAAGKQILPDIGFRYNVGEAGMNAWKPVVKIPEAPKVVKTPKTPKVVESPEIKKSKFSFKESSPNETDAKLFRDQSSKARRLSSEIQDESVKKILDDNMRIWHLMNKGAANELAWINAQDAKILTAFADDSVSAATLYKQKAKSLYIDLIATAPENIIGKGVSGAGSSIISKLSEIALSKGMNSISLEALKGAAPFYEKIGFKAGTITKDGLIKMKLDKKGMEALIQKIGGAAPEAKTAAKVAKAATKAEAITESAAVSSAEKRFVIKAVAENSTVYNELSEKAYEMYKAGNYENTVLRQNFDMWRAIGNAQKQPDMLIKNTYTASGNLSSSAAWKIKNGKTAYVEFLATSPNNIIGAGVSGSGTTTLAAIAEDALAQGLKEIKLSSLPSAQGFYEKIGFKQVGQSSIMKMNEKAMKTFVETVKQKGYFSECWI